MRNRGCFNSNLPPAAAEYFLWGCVKSLKALFGGLRRQIKLSFAAVGGGHPLLFPSL